MPFPLRKKPDLFFLITDYLQFCPLFLFLNLKMLLLFGNNQSAFSLAISLYSVENRHISSNFSGVTISMLYQQRLPPLSINPPPPPSNSFLIPSLSFPHYSFSSWSGFQTLPFGYFFHILSDLYLQSFYFSSCFYASSFHPRILNFPISSVFHFPH